MIPYARPKLSDLYTLFQSKLLENHTFHSAAYLCSSYMAVPSRNEIKLPKLTKSVAFLRGKKTYCFTLFQWFPLYLAENMYAKTVNVPGIFLCDRIMSCITKQCVPFTKPQNLLADFWFQVCHAISQWKQNQSIPNPHVIVIKLHIPLKTFLHKVDQCLAIVSPPVLLGFSVIEYML